MHPHFSLDNVSIDELFRCNDKMYVLHLRVSGDVRCPAAPPTAHLSSLAGAILIPLGVLSVFVPLL